MKLNPFSKRESELPADETSGLTPDLAVQNLYQSLGVTGLRSRSGQCPPFG